MPRTGSAYKTVGIFCGGRKWAIHAESQTEGIFCLFLTCCQPLQFDVGLDVAVVL